ncbi:MAG TPA: AAA family ATPase, partial [Planctomycetota bacterium]|nr:AAA family ATPase [Planctomycetota bacterium]
ELDPSSLYRFKNEFRSLADIYHRNLARLLELIHDDGRWFFTMELVEGTPFKAYVASELPAATGAGVGGVSSLPTLALEPGRSAPRQATAPPRLNVFDEARLRAAFRELALGLGAIHQAGKVHRDLKPSNVLVTAEGRVVILDFGLVTEIGSPGATTGGLIVGTPLYMAPEQARLGHVGPAADWYAAGTMLYEALVGRPPFSGGIGEVMAGKLSPRPLDPSAVALGLPRDLADLCRDLLAPDPEARPGAAEVLDRLDAARATGPANAGPIRGPGLTSSAMLVAPSLFIGRREDLEALDAAFARVRDERRAVLQIVHGESGIGKSALVRRFIELLGARAPGLVALSGRCYERETVPYKAFDGVVDALSRHLARLDPLEAGHALPTDVGALARVFPVLRRVEALERLADAAARAAVPAGIPASIRVAGHGSDALGLRVRAFAALREVIARLAARGPVVVYVDDLQWADADSLALLSELLDPAAAPPALFVATLRTATDTHPDLPSRIEALRARGGAVGDLYLESLSPGEARTLAARLIEAAGDGA